MNDDLRKMAPWLAGILAVALLGAAWHPAQAQPKPAFEPEVGQAGKDVVWGV